MRKKYLSALLFGALLVTSAGTFTSCKDYDDEINNLQEQIDVIKTDLASLTETVKNLDGVKDMSFDKETGKLYIETGEGKKVEVDIPSADGIAKIELKDNVLYVNDKPKGTVEIPEDKDVVVEVREDGKLYIDDQVQDLEIGSKVVMVDNGDYYTMTIDGKESYNLPKYNAAAEIKSMEIVETNPCFRNTAGQGSPEDILWGIASKDINWAGPKGNVKADQVLFGQVKTLENETEGEGIVSVTPATFDLSSEDLKLTLIDTKGNVAPVKVKAIPASDKALSASRAASANGRWNLALQFDNNISEDEVADIFRSGDDCILFALQVNGVIMTDYNIAVKVAGIENNQGASSPYGHIYQDGEKITTSNTDEPAITIKPGKTSTLFVENWKTYDSYIAFEGTNTAKAAAAGIKADGMTITVPSTAGNVTLEATINMLGIDGKTNKRIVNVTTTGTTTEDVVTLETTTLKIAPNTANFKIDLSKAFDGMTDAQIEAVNTLDHIVVTQPKDQKFLTLSTSDIEYLDKDGKKIETLGDLRDIKSVKITTTDNWNADVEEGTYELIFTMYDGTNESTRSEVRKVTAPVSVVLPTFDELFTKSDKWTAAGEFNAYMFLTNIANSDKKFAGFNIADAYITNENGTLATDNNFGVEVAKVGNISVYQTIASGVVGLKNDIVKDGNLITKTLEVTPSFKLLGKEGFKVIGSKFTATLHEYFENPQLVYYVNGEAQDKAVVTNGIIKGLTIDQGTNKKNGLALKFGSFEVAVGNEMNPDNSPFDIKESHDFDNGTYNFVSQFATCIDASVAVPTMPNIQATLKSNGGGIKLDGIKANESSTVTITFEDVMGVKTSASINF